jgi:putative heme-binding domain-containing protein
MADSDAKLIERGLEAGAGYSNPAFLAAWEKIVLDTRQTGVLRASALDRFPPDAHGREVAMRALHQKPDPKLFDAITARLGAEGAGDSASDALAAALGTANPEQSLTIATALARTDAGAARLLALAESAKVSPRLLVRSSVASGLESRSEPIRQRYLALTRALPSESVRLDQVIAERVANYRPGRTDPVNGAKVFAMNCAPCHRYKDTGGNIGPSLDGIGVRGPARLFEDILDPSRNVDPAFQRTTLKLKTGEEIVGMNYQATAESVTLTEIGGKVLTYSPAQVAAARTEPISVMPAVFEQTIAPDDLGDVIAFLLK